ncbi:MAG: glycosyltransferase family 2 protein [Patescibacteria group bacterium]|nr:glycosyltransferase family 2 protein [Patescibacteria group bacterium]
MDLSIIIISWNVREKLRENLKALEQSRGGLDMEIFVVDNNSEDGSAEMVKKEFPEVKLIANHDNLGFAKANNQAIKQASGDFILLLNPDMRVFPETLKNMADWMRQNKQATIAGCHLVNKKGETVKQVRRFPRLWDQLAIALKAPHIFPRILNKYLRNGFDYEKFASVDSIRGSFFMIRREAIENIGLLDERYFIWFEEVDYCQRVRESGGQVWHAPAAKCLDYVGRSFNQLPRGRAQKYFRDSQLVYFRKWQPLWQYWILKLAWIPGIIFSFLGRGLGIKSRTKT